MRMRSRGFDWMMINGRIWFDLGLSQTSSDG
jgi:hypothetical protein